MPDPAGLDGLTVGIPAARRAAETAALVRRWGGTPLVGPTVRETAAGDPGPVADATRAILDDPVGWSVHLTGVGTRRWLEVAGQAGLRQGLLSRLAEASLIPRGQKARAALTEAGLTAAWIPEGETSDEIARWLAPRLGPGDRVAVQLHGEPSPRLLAALRGAGAEVVEVQTYVWQLPEDPAPAEALVRAIAGGEVHALAVTSAPQVRFLADIAEGMGLRDELLAALRDQVYLAAVGSVAAGGLSDLGLEADLVAHPARMGALVRALAADRERVLAKAGRPG